MSLDKLQQIIEKELSNRKVYEDALDVVKSLQGLKQNERETIAAIDKLKKEIEKVKSDKDKADQDYLAVQQQILDMLNQTEAQVQEALNRAQQEAIQIKADAEKELVDLKKQVKAQKDKLADIEAGVVKANTEYDAISKAVETAKSKLKDLLA